MEGIYFESISQGSIFGGGGGSEELFCILIVVVIVKTYKIQKMNFTVCTLKISLKI